MALLESELDKVFTFQKLKSDEIVRRIQASDQEVSEVVSRLDQPGQNGSGTSPRRRDAPTDDDFLLLEEDLSDIIADVHDLAKYTQLNYTGFQKIIKKHDVRRHILSHSLPPSLFQLPVGNSVDVFNPL